jgi:hypothetical protein
MLIAGGIFLLLFIVCVVLLALSLSPKGTLEDSFPQHDLLPSEVVVTPQPGLTAVPEPSTLPPAPTTSWGIEGGGNEEP